jgi:hypothetical protein
MNTKFVVSLARHFSDTAERLDLEFATARDRAQWTLFPSQNARPKGDSNLLGSASFVRGSFSLVFAPSPSAATAGGRGRSRPRRGGILQRFVTSYTHTFTERGRRRAAFRRRVDIPFPDLPDRSAHSSPLWGIPRIPLSAPISAIHSS